MLKIIKKNKYLITIILILIIICLVIIRKKELKENNKEYKISVNSNLIKEDNKKDNKSSIGEDKKIIVDIKGQVITPGVYELEENSRVIDVINLAGGLTENANTSLINLSKKIEDGMVIIIYSNEEVANSNVKEVETVFKIIEKECNCPNIKNDSCINTELDNEVEKENINNNEETNKLVNINTASKEELMTLTSIGESKAEAIIKYRNETKFGTIEDIKNVSGIGDALFEKIKENITV